MPRDRCRRRGCCSVVSTFSHKSVAAAVSSTSCCREGLGFDLCHVGITARHAGRTSLSVLGVQQWQQRCVVVVCVMLRIVWWLHLIV